MLLLSDVTVILEEWIVYLEFYKSVTFGSSGLFASAKSHIGDDAKLSEIFTKFFLIESMW